MAEFVLRHDATRSTLRGGDTLQGANVTFQTLTATVTTSATVTSSAGVLLFSENRPTLRLRSPIGQEANLRAGQLRPFNSNPIGGITMSAPAIFAGKVYAGTITQSATLATTHELVWYDGPPPLLVATRSYGTLFGTSTPTRTYADLGTLAPTVYFVEGDVTITMSATLRTKLTRVAGKHHPRTHWPRCRPIHLTFHAHATPSLIHYRTSTTRPRIAVILPATPIYWNDQDDVDAMIRLLNDMESV